MKMSRLYDLYRYLSHERGNSIALGSKALIDLISPRKERIERDEFHVSLKYYPEKDLFQIRINSWNVSHHNGDPYGISKRSISLIKPFFQETFGEGKYNERSISLEEVLRLLISELEEEAMIKADREYRILEEKERQLEVKLFLERRIKDEQY